MSNQEILFRMLICEFMGCPISESIVKEFDHEFTYLFRVMDNFFPRELEPESFEGDMFKVRNSPFGGYMECSTKVDHPAPFRTGKVKITILDSCEELTCKNGELK